MLQTVMKWCIYNDNSIITNGKSNRRSRYGAISEHHQDGKCITNEDFECP